MDKERRFSLTLPKLEPLPQKSMSPRAHRVGEPVYEPKSPDGAKGASPRSGSFSARIARKQVKKTSSLHNYISSMVSDLENHDYSRLKLGKTSVDQQLQILTDGQGPDESDTEPPKIFFSETSQPLLLSQIVLHAIREIEEEQPDYADSVLDDTDACRMELSNWFYAMSEGIRQVSAHSKSLALLFDRMKSRLMDLFRILLNEVDEYQSMAVEQDPIVLDAIECENTPDAPFRADLFKLEVAVQNSNIGDADKISLLESLKKMGDVVHKRVGDEAELGRLRREVEKLKQRNKELSFSNFDIQSKKDSDEQKINDLMEVTKMLRKTISENEQKIDALSRASGPSQLSENMSMVPCAVVNLWEHVSQFCSQILNGALTSFDLSAMLPKDPTKKRPCFSFVMKKPEIRDEEIHFMSFFTEMKKSFDSPNVFSSLESAIRQFLESISKHYTDCFIDFKKETEMVASQAIHNLEQLRSTSSDGSALLGTFSMQPEYLQIPKKAKPVDIEVSLKQVYRYACGGHNHCSTSQAVAGAFGGYGSHALLPFIVQISKMSKDNADIDMFRRFLCDLPYHQFLFFARVFTKASEIKPADARSRKAFLVEVFGNYGWKTIPQTKKVTIENGYIQNGSRFPILCLAMYVHCIEGIQTQLEARLESPEEVAQEMLGLSPSEVFEASEFMKSVSIDGKVTFKELAVLLFRHNQPFQVLTDFVPEASMTIVAYDNFNIKKPKSKRAVEKPALPSLH